MEKKEYENGKNELFNKMVKAGQRTYFVSVKAAKNNNRYVTLTESKLVADNKFEKYNIFVFQNKLGDLVKVLQEAELVAA